MPPPPAAPNHTHNSPSQQFRGRDSRVVSIYDKYLYDPKDLESSDPRRRELARKASRMRLQGKAANVHEANGHNPPQRKSIAFANGTKAQDRSHEGPNQDRDSGAWGLGMGMLDGNSSGSESDSDDGHRGNVKGRSQAKSSRQPHDSFAEQERTRAVAGERESWSERAAAVSQRPPDNASQNPPGLKLMGLNSAKAGGNAIPPAPVPSSQSLDTNYGVDAEGQRRILSTSDYGDSASRHGSTINFGQGRDSLEFTEPSSRQPTTSSANHAGPQGARPISPKTELTRQLGLVTPIPPSNGNQQQGDYFAGAMPYQENSPAGPGPQGQRAPSPPRSAGLSNAYNGQVPPQARAPLPMAPPRSPGYGPGGPSGAPHNGRMPSPGMAAPGSYGQPGMMPRGPSPHAGPMAPSNNMPPNVLQRGPQPGYGNQPGPHPVQTLSPAGGPIRYANGEGPPPPGHMPMQMRGPSPGPGGMRVPPPPGHGPAPGPGRGPAPPGYAGPPGPNGFQRGPPPSQQKAAGPGFSDSPGPPKRQSIFRRSMAFFNGNPASRPGAGPQGPAGQQGQPGGAGPGGKRQSLFRRSMAFLGAGTSSAAPRGPPAAAPRVDPMLRVKGFEDDVEKSDHSRKSQFLGAGGAGSEWDTQGEGAKFWRRFSIAQKTAHALKMEEGSKAWHQTMAAGKRKLVVLTVVSLLILVGAIVGIIVWREVLYPSASDSSGQPGSLYHGNFGDGAAPPTATVVSGALDKRIAMPTGLAKRTMRAEVDEEAAYNVSLPRGSLEGSRNMVKRHRRRRSPSPAAWKETRRESGSLADID